MATSSEAWSYYQRAYELMAGQLTEGSVDRVVGHLRQSVRLDSRFGEAHCLLGRAYEYMANHRLGVGWWRRLQARRHLMRAVNLLAPDSLEGTEARLTLAASVARSGNTTRTRELLSRILRSGAREARRRALVYLGVAAFQSRHVEDAILHWREAMKLCEVSAVAVEASHPGGWLRTGYLKLAARAERQKRWANAIMYYQEIVALGGPFLQPADWLRLHRAYLAAGQRDQAREALAEANALHRELAGDEGEMAAQYGEDRKTIMANWGYAYDRQIDNLSADADDRMK